jgi:hypothetical protein
MQIAYHLGRSNARGATMKIQGRYTLKGRYGVWTITDTKTGSKSDYFDKPSALNEIRRRESRDANAAAANYLKSRAS